MVLGHNHLTNQPSGFPDVKLRAPMPVFNIFVFRVAPFSHLLPDKRRHRWVVADEIQQSFGIIFVVLYDLLSPLVVPFWIIPIHTDTIRRESIPRSKDGLVGKDC